MAAPNPASRPLAWMAIASYVAVLFGAIGLELRPPHDAPLAEALSNRLVGLMWVAGALVAIPAAWRDHWLEKVGTSAILGGTLISLAGAVLLDTLPAWPPLSRPVLTVTGLVVATLFFAARLVHLRHERPRIPAEEAIERADRIRGISTT